MDAMACPAQIITPFNVYFNAKLICQKFELWRLLTNFFFFGNLGEAGQPTWGTQHSEAFRAASVRSIRHACIQAMHASARLSQTPLGHQSHLLALRRLHAGLDFVFHMFFLIKYCKSLEEGEQRGAIIASGGGTWFERGWGGGAGGVDQRLRRCGVMYGWRSKAAERPRGEGVPMRPSDASQADRSGEEAAAQVTGPMQHRHATRGCLHAGRHAGMQASRRCQRLRRQRSRCLAALRCRLMMVFGV